MWYSACIKNTIYFFLTAKKKCNLALQQKLIKKQYVVEFLMCVARKWKSSCSIEDEKGSIWNLKQPKMCSDFFDRTSHFFSARFAHRTFCLFATDPLTRWNSHKHSFEMWRKKMKLLIISWPLWEHNATTLIEKRNKHEPLLRCVVIV